ncbi:MAG: DNA-3-methyladenine glycosylase II [uncultured Thermomicrobiales bacterium]|uniref:Putative 3-methyladenine DNA glycosylase n=1 Tax=uncultured Thermomicrobiales bacterium TaxID=1645740 RepID=A0A6J4UBP4_9BACT|nr:MAG: DNA-3-methyladenine glycosylase II [uncultured Thermomicrobiales bacterium]
MTDRGGAVRLDRCFFARDTASVAAALLGCVLVSTGSDGETRGRIVETEAYLGPADPASHAVTRRTVAPGAMAGTPGTVYVYRSYGLHVMLNPVAHPPGDVGAVLLRAVEPESGTGLMARRRGLAVPRLLCAGPGRLCQAFGITLADMGADLVAGERVWIERGAAPGAVARGGRIGITRGVDLPLRFFEAGNAFVSAHKRGEIVENAPAEAYP